MHSTRRKNPRILAFGMAFLVLTLCLAVEAANVVFAAPLPASSTRAAQDFTPGPANTAVTTYKQDSNRSGDQTNETILNTSNVNANSFGKKVSYPVDGQVYTQPLYVPDLTINGTAHNVVFVETEHASVYAFDADQTSPIAPLWHISFLGANIIAGTNLDVNCNDMVPENALSGTPVIDTTTNTMYVVVQTEDISKARPGTFTYKLHALDITTGQDVAGSPVTIKASVSGSGVGGSGGTISFDASRERQRAGLVLSQGKVYIAFASFCDHNPYHGWVMSYDSTTLQQLHVTNTTPNGTRGGIWGGGGALVADGAGSIYYVSGNGSFNGTSDFGDSFVKLDADLKVQDYFSPFNQKCLDDEDADLGSGGPLLLPGQNRLLGAGKEGRIYVLDTSNLGKYTNPFPNNTFCTSQQGSTTIDQITQELPPRTVKGLYTSAAYWQNTSGQQFIYYAGSNDNMKAFSFSGGKISNSPFAVGTDTYSYTGGNPTVSSNNGAAGTGVVWALAPQPKPSTGTQTAVLFAYDATTLTKLYSSRTNDNRDGLTSYVKFSAPTVANGEVFVTTQNSLDIFGLLAGSSSGTPTGSPTPTGTPNPNGYNNVGISYDNHTTAARYDFNGNSYSASALTAKGILQNGLVTGAGFLFRWPDAAPGSADNWVTNGETIPITPVDNADHLGFLGSAINGTSSGMVTLTYTDGSTQTVKLAFNDWAAKAVTSLVPGETVVATMPYRNTPAGQQAITVNLYVTSIAITAGKTLKSVQLPAIVTGGQLHVFALATSSLSAPIYNSVCIQEDGGANPGATQDNGNLSPPSCDGGPYAYSANALQRAGVVPGYQVVTNNFLFNWPNVPTNESDNFQASGQTVAVAPVIKADTLGFLGMATNGASSGTATIHYTDGTSTNFTLGFTDWASTTRSFGNTVAVQMPYRDRGDGSTQTKPMFLFVATAPLDTTKTLASVTLPSVVKGGQIHVFDIETRSATAPIYNNAGITDDSAVASGNFDGGGVSYSANALNGKGVNPGDNAFDPNRVVRFEWPTPLAGLADNYLCTGQVIPVDNPQPNSTILAFLGASANGAASGMITVTYTDGSSTQITLGFDDWTLGGGKVQKLSYTNEAISYALPYRNTRAGRQNVLTYVFYNFVSIDPTRTIASVTLPRTTQGGQMHIFAITAVAA
ncbi:MAG TPA: hypothetical protein VF458_10945 [Ktedonobacteraceae bacterium]